MRDINAGKLPKTIDCEIRDDMIDACISGDIVTICGIMKTELQNDMNAGNKNKNLGLAAEGLETANR
jgi:DNA helicase MCM8